MEKDSGLGGVETPLPTKYLERLWGRWNEDSEKAEKLTVATRLPGGSVLEPAQVSKRCVPVCATGACTAKSVCARVPAAASLRSIRSLKHTWVSQGSYQDDDDGKEKKREEVCIGYQGRGAGSWAD